jgi:hypothetical protein
MEHFAGLDVSVKQTSDRGHAESRRDGGEVLAMGKVKGVAADDKHTNNCPWTYNQPAVMFGAPRRRLWKPVAASQADEQGHHTFTKRKRRGKTRVGRRP